jgi:hypothetical protein
MDGTAANSSKVKKRSDLIKVMENAVIMVKNTIELTIVAKQ